MSPITRIFLLLAALAGLGGCLVTESKMKQELGRLESQIRSRSSSSLEGLDARLGRQEIKLASMENSLKAVEVSLKAMKTDLVALQGNIGKVFAAVDEVRETNEKAEKSLEAAGLLRTLTERSVKAMDVKVLEALKKYRDMLLEEKRLLAERMRFINASLRRLEGDGKEK